ncbi:MAG: hypothetical protein ACP5OK_09440 [Thermoprotei archaeon]
MLKKNPFVGIALGVGFMILGVLHVAYPELAGATTSSGKSFAAFIGILLFLVGLAQVFYIVASSIRKRVTHNKM